MKGFACLKLYLCEYESVIMCCASLLMAGEGALGLPDSLSLQRTVVGLVRENLLNGLSNTVLFNNN